MSFSPPGGGNKSYDKKYQGYLDHLKIVEKFGVCEEQGEEVVDVEAEVPGDDFSGVLALAPGLVGEYICCRG